MFQTLKNISGYDVFSKLQQDMSNDILAQKET